MIKNKISNSCLMNKKKNLRFSHRIYQNIANLVIWWARQMLYILIKMNISLKYGLKHLHVDKQRKILLKCRYPAKIPRKYTHKYYSIHLNFNCYHVFFNTKPCLNCCDVRFLITPLNKYCSSKIYMFYLSVLTEP